MWIDTKQELVVIVQKYFHTKKYTLLTDDHTKSYRMSFSSTTVNNIQRMLTFSKLQFIKDVYFSSSFVQKSEVNLSGHQLPTV